MQIKPPRPIDIDLSRSFFWPNPLHRPYKEVEKQLPYDGEKITDVQKRLERFAPFFQLVFPETCTSGGMIESPLKPLKKFPMYLMGRFSLPNRGRFFAKCDNQLMVAGSIKARGGFYEVLHFVEQLALNHGILKVGESYEKLASNEARQFFSTYSLLVGSTGNLGLAVGTMGRAFGLKTQVHMSKEAKGWKKSRLRQIGVEVVEHQADFIEAVNQARLQAEKDPLAYFVDDENSELLFQGYSRAALELKKQLSESGLIIGPKTPLFVYLPCGVGGAPGGITYGIKNLFGDSAHCFTAEPVACPSMFMALYLGGSEGKSIYDWDLDNRTNADGLAVPRASDIALKACRHLFNGCLTASDEELSYFLYHLYDKERIKIEPSAGAGFIAFRNFFDPRFYKSYLEKNHLIRVERNIIHVFWLTGGSFVPDREFELFLKEGEKIEIGKFGEPYRRLP